MSDQGQEATILVPSTNPEKKGEEKKVNGEGGKGKGKDEGKNEPEIVCFLSHWLRSIRCPS
jgi:hypothetical protein